LASSPTNLTPHPLLYELSHYRTQISLQSLISTRRRLHQTSTASFHRFLHKHYYRLISLAKTSSLLKRRGVVYVINLYSDYEQRATTPKRRMALTAAAENCLIIMMYEADA